MFERFSERAREVLVSAQEEALALRHGYVGPEHILLGMFGVPDGTAARALESLGLTPEGVRAHVADIVGTGTEPAIGQIPFTPKARQVLELARDEADDLGDTFIGTEHLLFALARQGGGVTGRILLDREVDADMIGAAVLALSGRPPAFAGPPGTASPAGDGVRSELPRSEVGFALGWRARPIALAALGAAVLARAAFDPARTGSLSELQMQLLVQLAIDPSEGPRTNDGELFESLTAALACERDDLRDAYRRLEDRGMVTSAREQDDDVRITITAAGAAGVDEWLRRTASLFGRWPPDDPAADDAA